MERWVSQKLLLAFWGGPCEVKSRGRELTFGFDVSFSRPGLNAWFLGTVLPTAAIEEMAGWQDRAASGNVYSFERSEPVCFRSFARLVFSRFADHLGLFNGSSSVVVVDVSRTTPRSALI
jgi:hypothetical protein